MALGRDDRIPGHHGVVLWGVCSIPSWYPVCAQLAFLPHIKQDITLFRTQQWLVSPEPGLVCAPQPRRGCGTDEGAQPWLPTLCQHAVTPV